MPKVRQMQGVPAHLETLKVTDKRRHPSHCVFHEGPGRNRICKCTVSPNYEIHCRSAAKCDFYKEK